MHRISLPRPQIMIHSVQKVHSAFTAGEKPCCKAEFWGIEEQDKQSIEKGRKMKIAKALRNLFLHLGESSSEMWMRTSHHLHLFGHMHSQG
jgi:hypothetical protein